MTKLGNPAAFGGEGNAVELKTVSATFTLQKNGNITAKFTLAGGNTFSVDTGLDRDGLVDKAVKVLNAAIAATPPKVEKPRAEKTAVDDTMKAINELESGGIEELDDVETESAPKKEKGVMDKDALLRGLDIVFNALKSAKGQEERQSLREANMEAVVTALQQALDRARHLDNRNTELINNVREVFSGNANVDSDALLKEISDVLNKKRFDPQAKIEENKKNPVEDDFSENLNINAWLGED